MTLATQHLLVVDDNPVNVEMILDLLDDHGFDHAHGLSDPRAVLSYCQSSRPDLLLLDIRMPHLDGYGVIEQLRDHFGNQMPPIIVLTAQVDDATRHRALEMGVRDFLTKPFKHDEVLQRICNILDVEQRFSLRDQQAATLAHLSLEVTESGLMNDIHNARQQLEQLHAAGIAVAVDDFGTGHSSLAYLKTPPLSTLKIDRAFVMDLEDSLVDRQLARTITQLAHGVGCNVVAEGIETPAQAEYLRSIGCEIMQGYFYSRPLPDTAFTTFCTTWENAPSQPDATAYWRH
jgi:DNA-binding response OmpR family regulator